MTKAEENFWEEIKKASRRIGWSNESAFEWLLRFAQTDVTKLSEGQWLDLRAELEVFFYCGVPQSDHDLADREFFANPNRKKERKWSSFIKQATGVVPTLQKSLHKALEDLIKNGKAVFEPIKITLAVTRESPVGKPSILPSRGTDPQDLFLFHAIQLIEIFKKNIHSCRECGRMFLGYRFQQNFCSPPCQNRANQRKVRERRKKQRKPNKPSFKPGKLIPARDDAIPEGKGEQGPGY